MLFRFSMQIGAKMPTERPCAMKNNSLLFYRGGFTTGLKRTSRRLGHGYVGLLLYLYSVSRLISLAFFTIFCCRSELN